MVSIQLSRIERWLHCERTIVALGLALLTLLAWLYLLRGAGTGMSVWAMSSWQLPALLSLTPQSISWDVYYALLMLTMWWVMMIAMMLPSAAPMILLYARVLRHNRDFYTRSNDSFKWLLLERTGCFVLGYLLAWLLFSVLAAAIQWGLEQSGLLHSMMMWSSSRVCSGVLLLLAGVYQLSSMKTQCLQQCRAPAEFIARYSADGPLRMGWRHGVFCVGCCWALMTLLFVGGAMNLLWIVGLSLLVLLEKLLPTGHLYSRLTGGVLLAAGVGLLVFL